MLEKESKENIKTISGSTYNTEKNEKRMNMPVGGELTISKGNVMMLSDEIYRWRKLYHDTY